MNRIVLAALAAVGLALSANAEAAEAPDRAAILATVDRFFSAMKAGDGKALADVQFTDGMFDIQHQAADGSFAFARPKATAVLENLVKSPGLDEHIWAPTVLQRGPMALVWAPYEFKADGKTAHCGIDAFDLMKTDAGWKITHFMWTAEPKACSELKALDK